jgi:phosphatidylserine/phosphatidylglycerophosphate/cardiolipin synthase-like enzyme
MRTPPDTSGALTARAIAGSRAVLLGFDLASAPQRDFLGFAVHKTDQVSGEAGWIPNFLRFAANDHPDGPVGTDRNPLQAFQWGDYTVEPGQQLRYRVVALSGAPDAPVEGDEVVLDVICERADDGKHGIYFNRGVAGSQAYTRKFGDGSPLDIPAAAEWMSRGLEEALVDFIARADGPGWALHGAFYEFFHPPILGALHKAARAKAEVSMAIACPMSSGWPDYPAGQNIDAIRAFAGKTKPPPSYKGLSTFVKPRTHSKAIAHNKFLVLLKDGAPQGVWTGSTNVTPGALYGQSNVGHVVWDPAVAQVYLDYWALLLADEEPPEGPAAVAAFTEADTALSAVKDAGTSPVLSPRANLKALDFYADLIRHAGQAVFITGPFGLADQISSALAEQSDKPRYELLESSDRDLIDVLRADPDNQVAAGAYLGSSGGWHQFLKEQLTGLNEHVKYIHTKYLIVDPLTSNPTVVTGSANFSAASTNKNDENMLVIKGDQRVADIYLSEFMRLFTHLRFRGKVTGTDTDRRAPDPAEPAISAPIHLAENSRWADEYFVADSPKARERELFARAV